MAALFWYATQSCVGIICVCQASRGKLASQGGVFAGAELAATVVDDRSGGCAWEAKNLSPIVWLAAAERKRLLLCLFLFGSSENSAGCAREQTRRLLARRAVRKNGQAGGQVKKNKKTTTTTSVSAQAELELAH